MVCLYRVGVLFCDFGGFSGNVKAAVPGNAQPQNAGQGMDDGQDGGRGMGRGK